MGRKKKNETQGIKTNMIYCDPYLNFVRAILERTANDLVADENDGATKKNRNDALSFFFDETSFFYQGFCQWCAMAGFSEYFWQQKALMKLAMKIVKKPTFYRKVKIFAQSSKFGSMLRYLVNTLQHNYHDVLTLGEKD